ncbi:hypothetical protein SISSUDRAFT_1114849 [Sistotremastrum suecicum HHB10207 ss-3]|uniref:Uncharacterized protein n=1 Tax=Sistotremastrum suecicum HHB10207 ss-3 TaxID=1314776 RepID=A0A166AMG1_9AGAM|nr:hypothetical protein SISSUDRAFT_1114849 [Sistotremastrum suecicum HHB10207 ss-3]
MSPSSSTSTPKSRRRRRLRSRDRSRSRSRSLGRARSRSLSRDRDHDRHRNQRHGSRSDDYRVKRSRSPASRHSRNLSKRSNSHSRSRSPAPARRSSIASSKASSHGPLDKGKAREIHSPPPPPMAAPMRVDTPPPNPNGPKRTPTAPFALRHKSTSASASGSAPQTPSTSTFAWPSEPTMSLPPAPPPLLSPAMAPPPPPPISMAPPSVPGFSDSPPLAPSVPAVPAPAIESVPLRLPESNRSVWVERIKVLVDAVFARDKHAKLEREVRRLQAHAANPPVPGMTKLLEEAGQQCDDAKRSLNELVERLSDPSFWPLIGSLDPQRAGINPEIIEHLGVRIDRVEQYLEEFTKIVEENVNQLFQGHLTFHKEERAEIDAIIAAQGPPSKRLGTESPKPEDDDMADEKAAIREELENRVANLEESLEEVKEARKEEQRDKVEEQLEARFNELSLKQTAASEELAKYATLVSAVKEEQTTGNAAVVARMEAVQNQLTEALARITTLESENLSLKESLSEIPTKLDALGERLTNQDKANDTFAAKVQNQLHDSRDELHAAFQADWRAYADALMTKHHSSVVTMIESGLNKIDEDLKPTMRLIHELYQFAATHARTQGPEVQPQQQPAPTQGQVRVQAPAPAQPQPRVQAQPQGHPQAPARSVSQHSPVLGPPRTRPPSQHSQPQGSRPPPQQMTPQQQQQQLQQQQLQSQHPAPLPFPAPRRASGSSVPSQRQPNVGSHGAVGQPSQARTPTQAQLFQGAPPPQQMIPGPPAQPFPPPHPQARSPLVQSHPQLPPFPQMQQPQQAQPERFLVSVTASQLARLNEPYNAQQQRIRQQQQQQQVGHGAPPPQRAQTTPVVAQLQAQIQQAAAHPLNQPQYPPNQPNQPPQ